jgi:hypothetical protein
MGNCFPPKELTFPNISASLGDLEFAKLSVLIVEDVKVAMTTHAHSETLGHSS